MQLLIALLLPLLVQSFVLPTSRMNHIFKNLAQSSASWDELWAQGKNNKVPFPRTIPEAKRAVLEAESESQADPYNIQFTEEENYTRISFTSLLYRERPALIPQRYMLVNKLPSFCNGQLDLPYVVFLPGYGAVPEDYGAGFPFMYDLINNGSICCFYAFMPFFFILPTGGYWYTNNDVSVPELYLFVEVMTVITKAMGNNITSDPERRILAGHSMGGYGAVMNAMRTNMQFFGSVCGLNGGLYVWNLPEFQDSVAEDIINEAIARKAGPFNSCNYEQPPYRYYADDVNFNTMVASSLAGVFLADGTTVPKINSPYFSPTLFNPNCLAYAQFFGFRFWLDEYGNLDDELFNVAPWNSPLGFLQLNYPALQIELDGNLYLSSTYNDTLVNYLENVQFSDALVEYNITHVFELFSGDHYDIFDGVQGCLTNFAPKVCKAPAPAPGGPAPGDDVVPPPSATMPVWAFVVAASVAAVLLIVVVILAAKFCSRKSEYVRIEQ